MVGVWDASGCAARQIEGRHSKKSTSQERKAFNIFGASERRERFTTKDAWRGGKFCLLYWDEIARTQLAKTSHIDCAVLKHGAARLGLYKRAARRKVRFVFYSAVAMRRGAAQQRGRHRHHSRH